MTGIIILAAGSSSRLGKPKQNLVFKSKTLLQNTIDAAKKSSGNPVIVVLGAYQQSISVGIDQQEVKIVHNTDWKEGMASSIRAGLKYLIDAYPNSDQVILMVCDQPFVTAGLLNQLITKNLETGKNIIACIYGNATGTPVLFTRQFFEELLLLNGQEGAKKLLPLHKESTATIAFPEGATDIDTIDDYLALHPSNIS